jgi:hypothetical protein
MHTLAPALFWNPVLRGGAIKPILFASPAGDQSGSKLPFCLASLLTA